MNAFTIPKASCMSKARKPAKVDLEPRKSIVIQGVKDFEAHKAEVAIRNSKSDVLDKMFHRLK